MVRALKHIPGIDRVKTGFDMDGGVRHRIIEYRFIDKAGLESDIRFNAQTNGALDGHPDIYIAILANGLQEEGLDGRPTKVNDFGTGNVIDRWKAQCGVGATTLSF